MKLIDKLPEKAANVLEPMALTAKENVPTIFLVGGIVLTVGATVVACARTPKAKDILDKTQDKLGAIDHIRTKDDGNGGTTEYTEEDRVKDRTKITVQGAALVAKEYAIPMAMLATGVVLLVSSHNIEHARLVKVTGSYNALLALFTEYRGQVRRDHGEEADRMYIHGSEVIEVEETKTRAGKEKVVKKQVRVLSPTREDVYNRIFSRDTTSEWVHPDQMPGYNRAFLEGQQRYFNQMYDVKGYVLLTDVCDSLGLSLEDFGDTLGKGWHKDHPNAAAREASEDKVAIDFGIFTAENLGKRDWGEIAEDVYYLTFNCDGDISECFRK